MRKATLGERLRYAFDRSLSGGTVSLIGWLALGSLVIVLTATAVILLAGLAFYTVAESARRRGETAIGYRLERHSGDSARAYGVRVNPPKSEAVTFQTEDRIVVLAED